MPVVIPYVPENITVHLGAPSTGGTNVTVSFPNYVKNVASSEIYPTWGESALRANIWAIISFALNRIYTEYYRSRGYAFDITSSTAVDQSFVNGRNFFENISRIVDDMFNSYIRRQGFVEPLSARFCNGTTVTCDGLSQWGSQALAQQGYNSIQILRSYYGQNIEIVRNAPQQSITRSYPGTPLRQGSTGPNVVVVQTSLNRISQNYPAIPKVNPVDGIFGSRTRASVVAFQRIFNLAADGIVGNATWYALVRLYVGVTRLGELYSEGQTFFGISWAYPDAIKEGDSGTKVTHLQYMLAVNSEFIPELLPVPVTGNFDAQTREAVLAFQRRYGLLPTGTVGKETWDVIYDQFAGVSGTIFDRAGSDNQQTAETFATNSVRGVQMQLQQLAQTNASLSAPAATGSLDRNTQQSIRQLQRFYGLPVTGQLDSAFQNAMRNAQSDSQFKDTTQLTQFPGHDLSLGGRDSNVEVNNARS